jgi:hypothetical protein
LIHRYQHFIGWTAVALSTVAACFWAAWGIIENFHEGWYYASLWKNLGLLFAQYLLLSIILVAAAMVAIRWPRVGAGIHLAGALWAAWFFRRSSPMVIYPFIVLPLLLISGCYLFGRARPRRWAAMVVVTLPLITLVICGAGPAYRVARRFDDGERSARHTNQNDVDLIWAPQGPGWPEDGVTWNEAVRRCRFLAEDGRTLSATPQNIWRLPTVDQAVRSMQRHGRNSSGSWDPIEHKASYRIDPDKESPLWNVHSKVIYWWTATEVDDRTAYIIVYDGQVRARLKEARWGYLGFRAVKGGKNHSIGNLDISP